MELFYIRKQRSIFQILQATVQYMGKHANVLFLSIALLALPFILLPTYFANYLTHDSTPFDEFFYDKTSMDKPAFVAYCLLFVLFALGLGIYNMVINKFMVLSDRSASATITTDLIKQGFLESLKKWLPNFCFFFVAYYFLWHGIRLLFEFKTYYHNGLQVYTEDPVTYYSELSIPYLPIIAISPFACYLVFSSLYVSFRDGADTTAALKTVWETGRKHLKKIFLGACAILLAVMVAYYLLNRLFILMYYFMFSTSLPEHFYVLVNIIRIGFGFSIITFMQIAFILLLGSMEDDQESHYIRQQLDKIEI